MGNSEPISGVRDNGGRRLGGDRRRFSYAIHIPERRPGSDRRSGLDRRVGLDPPMGPEFTWKRLEAGPPSCWCMGGP